MTAFTLMVLVLGVSFSKSGGSVKSFFAAGGAVPWWIAGLSMFMSFFSVGTFVVWGSIAYKTGLVAVVIQITMSIAGFLVGYFIAPKWNRTKSLTAAEFIADRLGEKTQKFYTSIFLVISLFGAGAFLYPVGKMIEVTMGLPLETSIVLLGLIIILYTAIGGLWAVLVTDVLQFVVLTAAVLIVVPLAFIEVGGVNEFVASAPNNFFALTNDEYDWYFMAAFGFYNMVFIGGSWAFVQRFTSVASPQDAKKVGLMFGGLYLVAPVIWMLPPMIYRVLNPDLAGKDPEAAYLQISQLVVPDGLMGLILGAMVFATASSVNTTLNICAGVFTNDVFKKAFKKSNEKQHMVVARVATILFGIIAIFVALSVTSMGGIVEVVFSLAAITGVALFLPPIWAMFSKVQNGLSVVLVSLISLLVNGFFKFVSPTMFEVSLSRSNEMLVGVVTPIVILLIVELVGKFRNSPSGAYLRYQETRQDKHSQVSVEELSESAKANSFGRFIIGLGILLTGMILVLLGILADKGNAIILSIGVVTVVLSVWLFPVTFKRKMFGGKVNV